MNQNSPRASALIYTAVAFALTAINLVLQVLSLTLCYDASIGYFEPNAILPILSEVFPVASVVVLAVLAVLWLRKRDTAYPKTPNIAVKITSAIAAVISLLLGIHDLKVGASVVSLLLCFGACLYFLLVLTAKTTPVLALVFGFCLIFRLLSALSASYTDLFIPMNSPEKLWLYLGIVAAIFFLVSELRALVTKPYTALWCFSAASASLLTGASAIALIVGNRASLFYGAPTEDGLIVALLLLAIALYAGTRLFSMALTPTPIELDEKAETIEEPDQQ